MVHRGRSIVQLVSAVGLVALAAGLSQPSPAAADSAPHADVYMSAAVVARSGSKVTATVTMGNNGPDSVSGSSNGWSVIESSISVNPASSLVSLSPGCDPEPSGPSVVLRCPPIKDLAAGETRTWSVVMDSPITLGGGFGGGYLDDPELGNNAFALNLGSPQASLDARCDDYFVQRKSTLTVAADEGIFANDTGAPPAVAKLVKTSFAARKFHLDRKSGAFTFVASANNSRQGWFDYRLEVPGSNAASQDTRVYLNIYDGGHPPKSLKGHCADGIEFKSVDLGKELAPLVWLHSDEKYFPADATRFVRESGLKFAHGGRCVNHSGVALPGGWDQAGIEALGGRVAPFGHEMASSGHCSYGNDDATLHRPEKGVFHTDDYTCPWRKEADRASLPTSEGWYLDHLDNGKRDLSTGSRSGPWPVYTGYSDDRRELNYWMFYAASVYRIVGDHGAPLSRGKHEGDWERVGIALNGTVPTDVYYYRHGEPVSVPYEKAERYGKHPVVFSARFGHASYPAPTGGPGDAADRGRRWKTWQHVHGLYGEPWYGFGGAWGWVDEHGTGKAEASGPSGPSRYKTS
jgi:hypothetical protein